jgi:ferredoxin
MVGYGEVLMNIKKKKNDLKKLVALMNKQNRRFVPARAPLLDTLDLVLSTEELGLLLTLQTGLYAFEEAHALSGMDSAVFGPVFDTLLRKGFIGIKYTAAGEERYTLRPFIVGWLEAQVSYLDGRPEEREFARRYMEFYNTLRRYNFFPLRNVLNTLYRRAPFTNQSIGMVQAEKDEGGRSVITIDEAVSVPDSKIYPAKSVNDLIWDYGKGGVIGKFNACMCRKLTANVDDPCCFHMPDDGACMGFGDAIRPYIRHGYARQISREEAFDIIQKMRDHGAIHTVFHEQDDATQPQIGVCNCCWDCCGRFRSYNMGAVPLRFSCYYLARIKDISKCTGCGRCVRYCPSAAATLVENKIEIDPEKCIGCGQCAHQCSFSAVEMIENTRTAFVPILRKSEARIKP